MEGGNVAVALHVPEYVHFWRYSNISVDYSQEVVGYRSCQFVACLVLSLCCLLNRRVHLKGGVFTVG